MAEPENELPELLPLPEVARLLGLGYQRTRTIVLRDLPHHRLGGRVYVSRADLTRYVLVDSRCEPSGSGRKGRPSPDVNREPGSW